MLVAAPGLLSTTNGWPSAATATDTIPAPRCRRHRRRRSRPRGAPAAPGNRAHARDTAALAQASRPRPDAEIFGGAMSFGFDVGELVDLGPLVGLVGDEFAERG